MDDNAANHDQCPASLADWLATPLGAYTLAREQAWLDTVTPDIFGYHAVQLGLPEFDLLHEAFDWDEGQFARLNTQALDAAFCDADTRARILKRLEPGDA